MQALRSRSIAGWKLRLSGVSLALTLSASLSMAQAPTYNLQATWKLGGEGSWDYLTVDSTAHRLYIARANRVMVVDTEKGKLLTEVTGLQGVHGVALDAQGQFGYISDGMAGEVRVFDRAKNKIVASVRAGENPDAILIEPSTRTVYAFNGRSKNVTVIDTSSRKVLGTIALPGKPEFAETDGQGTIFVNIEDTNQLVRIDARSRQVTATWPLAGCEEPSGLAFDVAHKRLFSVCSNKKMIVTDADTGALVASPEIGQNPDAVKFDPQRNLIFSSNGDGTLTILNGDPAQNYPVLETVQTKKGARTMALDPATGRAYLVAAEMGPRPPRTPENPKPKPRIIPGSFAVLVVGK